MRIRVEAQLSFALVLLTTLLTGCPLKAPSKKKVTKPRTEQEAIVADVVQSVTSLKRFVARKPYRIDSIVAQARTAWNAPELTLQLRGVDGDREFELTIAHHIWAPENYALLVEVEPSKNTPALQSGFLEALRTPTLAVLEVQNTKLSAQLNESPDHPGLHYRAALLIGALGLREAPGQTFWDLRDLLNRMSAHLAVADALSGEAGRPAEAEVAHSLLLVLVGRTAEAVERLEGFEAEPGSAEDTWRRALRMKATRDWRILRDPGSASHLEQLVYVSALEAALGIAHASAFVTSLNHDAPPLDFIRSALWRKKDVVSCNLLVSISPDREARTAWKARSTEHGAPFPEALNAIATPGGIVESNDRGARINVIDWGLLASVLQRHLLGDVVRTHECFERTLGLDEQTAQVYAWLHSLSALRLYPFAALELAPEREAFLKASRAAKEVLEADPQRVTPQIWAQAQAKHPRGGAPSRDIPNERAFFRPRYPKGTALRKTPARSFGPGNNGNWLPKPARQTLVELDPYEYGRALGLARWDHPKPPYEVLVKAWDRLTGYNSRVAYRLAHAARQEKRNEAFERWSKSACEMDAHYCYSVARWAMDDGDEPRAAKYYRRWFEKTPDRVSAANGVKWLVDYELEHKRFDEAERLARIAAETYSAPGLTALGKVLEKRAKLEEAEEVYKKIDDRYQSMVRVAFYKRQAKAGRAPYRRKLESAMSRPPISALQKLEIRDTTKPPDSGARVVGPTRTLREQGIQDGHIIVGLDDYRIRSRLDYYAVRALREEPHLNLTIWTHKDYIETTLEESERGTFTLIDYKAR